MWVQNQPIVIMIHDIILPIYVPTLEGTSTVRCFGFWHCGPSQHSANNFFARILNLAGSHQKQCFFSMLAIFDVEEVDGARVVSRLA